MPDLICSLVNLPSFAPQAANLANAGVAIRRPHPWEQTKLRAFIETHFSVGWADETAVAFSHQPVSAFIVTRGAEIVGFAAYDCSRRGFFGPTGVLESERGKGLGAALLIASLIGLRDAGFVYAIIGAAGPVDFYAKTAGAVPIPIDEGRGIYHIKNEPGFEA